MTDGFTCPQGSSEQLYNSTSYPGASEEDHFLVIDVIFPGLGCLCQELKQLGVKLIPQYLRHLLEFPLPFLTLLV